MNWPLRTAIVGFGKMGLLHGGTASIHDDMELRAICEKNSFVRKAVASIIKNVHVYEDYNTMIEKEELDAVIITTPTFNHCEIAKKCAEKGIAVFCEKPLAINGIQASTLSKVFEEQNVPSLVGFSNRFYPTFSKGKTMLEENKIGEIISVNAEMYIGDVFKESTGWRYNPTLSGGGALIDFGIHMVDLLIWYFGDIKSVEASSKKIYSKDVEDELSATIECASGLNISFETSWSKPEYRKSSPIITITGTEGVMIVTEQTLDIDDGKENRRYSYPDLYKGTFADLTTINYSYEMQCFVDECKGIKSGLDVKQAAYVQKVVDCMYKSCETGKKEEVD